MEKPEKTQNLEALLRTVLKGKGIEISKGGAGNFNVNLKICKKLKINYGLFYSDDKVIYFLKIGSLRKELKENEVSNQLTKSIIESYKNMQKILKEEYLIQKEEHIGPHLYRICT